MRVGRSCQRFMLAAAARGLKHAFANQPVEVALRPALAALIGEPASGPTLCCVSAMGRPCLILRAVLSVLMPEHYRAEAGMI
jgi:acetyl-CoA carboxylase alpha subunit